MIKIRLINRLRKLHYTIYKKIVMKKHKILKFPIFKTWLIKLIISNNYKKHYQIRKKIKLKKEN